MHSKIRSWLDQVNSPRFDPAVIDSFINTASDEIIRGIIDGIDSKGLTSPQRDQAIRDKLSTIFHKDTLAHVTNKTLTNDAEDFYQLIALYPIVDGEKIYKSYPIRASEIDEIMTDPYKQPRITIPAKVYYMESSNGIEMFIPTGSVVTSADIYYISKPVDVDYGIVHTVSSGTFTDNIPKIVYTRECMFKSVKYKRGDLITPAIGENITSGEVVTNYVNSELPERLHEEICLLATKELALSIKDIEVAKALLSILQK